MSFRRELMVLSAFLGLTGCQMIVTEDLKESVCDFDGDGIKRAGELCGGNDCNDNKKQIGAPTGWFRDVDGDTYGAGEETFSCEQPDGFVDRNSDCDDTNELANPSMAETCNGFDDNCDGNVDDENITIWYADTDLDGYGDPEATQTQCAQPEGFVDNDRDCDDTTNAISPDDPEICDDGIDQDCNGRIDDAEDAQAWYMDADRDTYGTSDDVLYSCAETVEGRVLNADDCDDTDYNISPAASEVCADGIDNNCNGTVDTDAETVDWYRDVDSDGFGTASESVEDCAPPEGYVSNADDCNDADLDVHPAADEVCNNDIDDNCDGTATPCEVTGILDLSMEADIEILGSSGMNFGFRTANAGDVNQDGYEDLLVSAYGQNTVYLFLGPLSGSLSTTDAYATLTGESGTATGYSLSGNCNLDSGTGGSDFIIGSGSDGIEGNEGAVWVILDGLGSGTHTLSEVAYKISGNESDRLGTDVSCEGDLNGDGTDDLAMGAFKTGGTGGVFLTMGPITADQSVDDAILLSGTHSGADAGQAVQVIPDLSGDGADELLIGAPFLNGGTIYLMESPFESTSLSEGNVFEAEASADNAGFNVGFAGDLDGDGQDNLLIGAYRSSPGASEAGTVYAPSVTSTGSLSSTLKLTGESSGDNAGIAVAGNCDFNDDGHVDLLIGARKESTGGTDAGAAYVFLGPVSSGSLSTATAKLYGPNGSNAGQWVAWIDHNADGRCDPIISAPQRASDEGAVYLFNGIHE